MADPTPSLWRRLRTVLVTVFLIGVAVIVVGNVYVLSVTAGSIYSRVEDVPPRAMAIVLGAHVRRGIPSSGLVGRLSAARDLHRSRKVERIIVSGAWRPPYDEPDVMMRWLLSQGIPQDAIGVDRGGSRTRATMVRAASVFNVRGAVVCTQSYHLPRALLLARKAGIDAVGIAADGEVYARHRFREVIARPAMLLETAFGL